MRGLTLRLVLLCLTVNSLSFPSLVAQNRRLLVVKPDDAELRREARRLRTCPGTLKNIREALQEAINLAPEVAMTRPTSVGNQIVHFQRSSAEEIIVSLFQNLDNKARRAATRHEYVSLTQSSMELISALDRISPDTAAKLEDQWPPDPFADQPGAPNMRDPIATRKLYRDIARDPVRVLADLNTHEKGSLNYQVRNGLLYQLIEHGEENTARQLALDTFANPAAYAPQGQQLFALSHFARSAMTMFPELSEQALAALSTWYGAMAQAGGGGPTEFTAPTGERMKLTRADQELLMILMQSGRGNPEVAQKIADLSPALKDQIGAAGGLNTFLNPNPGKRMLTRGSVRRSSPEQLEAKVNEAKDSGEITRLAADLCFEAPEKAERVFASALKRVQAETDAKKAANDFMNIGRQCSSCLGELPDSWLQAGRALLAKAEESSREQSQMATLTPAEAGIGIGNRSWDGLASGLRQFLIGQKALVDFQGAMADANAVEDKSQRFDLLIAIVTGLGPY